jgi:hypothetical protein
MNLCVAALYCKYSFGLTSMYLSDFNTRRIALPDSTNTFFHPLQSPMHTKFNVFTSMIIGLVFMTSRNAALLHITCSTTTCETISAYGIPSGVAQVAFISAKDRSLELDRMETSHRTMVIRVIAIDRALMECGGLVKRDVSLEAVSEVS